MAEVVCALDAKAYLGEGPLWDVAEQALYWVDIKRREVHRFDPDTGQDQQWDMPEDVGSLALREHGGLVVALASGFHSFNPETGLLEAIAQPELDATQTRFNDGKPDRQGRFWAGSMDDKESRALGSLYRLDCDGVCKPLVDGITVANALCWSPDSKTLYFGDSPRRTIWAWDFEPESGTIGNRRVYIEVEQGRGYPDGATVDAEGCVWVAFWRGWRIDRYRPDGSLERSVKLPVQCPTCPAFGGRNLDTLYITSASNAIDDPASQPLAGAIFALQPGVSGLPEQRYRG